MTISVFDLFKVGIGPSSSHTVGPMKACKLFLAKLRSEGHFEKVDCVTVELYGSLALTGIGHGTDKAVILGLMGFEPETIDPDIMEPSIREIGASKKIKLGGSRKIDFDMKKNLVFFRRKSLPDHPNGMIFRSYQNATEVLSQTYYSIGGGFVVTAGSREDDKVAPERDVPYQFTSAQQLVAMAEAAGLTIGGLMMANEESLRTQAEVIDKLDNIWATMDACIERGFQTEGVLPGKLNVKRRAHSIHQYLSKNPELSLRDPLTILDWVNLYALAVNEENASGSRVVTAPTNGAAGIIPAVIRYYLKFCSGSNKGGIREFLLTAGAIGSLYAENASISGAEVGCQGEVGVACSMAAGALCAVLGGTVRQVEEAAEIGMEHNLGLTCDPIGGLVQIPCIERNAMASVKAINAARIALRGTGSHFVSLDSVIKTMIATGRDMMNKYKETSRGGLAVNVIEC